jgi:hypothetical protein
MRRVFTGVVTTALVALFATYAHAQTAGNTDIYHVHFTKALPGQGAALGEALKQPATDTPMPDHFVVLRHQHGDDWDYCVIQHLGPKVTIDAGRTPPVAGRALRAGHNDTFALGPSWPEFVKALGLGDAAKTTAGSVYTVAAWSEAPGQRDALGKTLREPEPSKVPVSRVVLQHMEGASWTFLAIDRYNSWQDFATDQSAGTPAGGTDGWSRIRQHGASHHDTLADRIFP